MTVKIKRSWLKNLKDALYNLIEVLYPEVRVDLAAFATLTAALRTSQLMDQVLNSPALAIGTTVTFSYGAFDYQIGALTSGVNTYKKKALSAGLAFGALGTIPASKWGLILVQINASGTVSFVSAAANYTTGYTTEAAAIAAIPAATAANAVMGYITILASASTFVVGTDALATGTGGNPATTTNYFNAGANFGSVIGAAVTPTAEAVTLL